MNRICPLHRLTANLRIRIAPVVAGGKAAAASLRRCSAAATVADPIDPEQGYQEIFLWPKQKIHHLTH